MQIQGEFQRGLNISEIFNPRGPKISTGMSKYFDIFGPGELKGVHFSRDMPYSCMQVAIVVGSNIASYLYAFKITRIAS